MIDPMSGYPGYLLRRASALAMARLAKRLKTLHLSPTDATVLSVIDANPNSKQSEIGRVLDIARANMAPLSRAGRALIPRIKSAFAQHEAALVKEIPASQRRAFVAGLRALLRKI
jgi:DNA-binding MarR family transcriptional regulator